MASRTWSRQPKSSAATSFGLLPPQTQDRLIALATSQSQGRTAEEFEAFLRWYWPLWARPEQLEPEGNWAYWLILAGRGYGKTRAGAEWVRKSATQGLFKHVNIIGATADDARDIMVEGESGILAVCPSWERPEYLPTKRRLEWPNGCKTLIFTADEPERLRGKQHQRLWADELACLATGTLVVGEYGQKPIERIEPGDRVWTRNGLECVLASGLSGVDDLYEVEFSNGQALTGNGKHPIWVEGEGFVPLAALLPGDMLLPWDESSGTAGIGTRTPGTAITATGVDSFCIGRFGSEKSDRSPPVTRSTTATETAPTTGSRTWNVCPAANISTALILCVVGPSGRRKSDGEAVSRPGSGANQRSAPASSAARGSLQPGCVPASAPTSASRPIAATPGWTTSPASVLPAGGSSPSAATAPSAAAPVFVLRVRKLGRRGPVYNLTVEGTPEFFANGVLTHNSWRYQEAWDQAMFGLRLGPDPKAVITTTPKPRPILRDLLDRPGLVISKGTTYENEENLAPEFFAEIIRKYEGTRLGQQELEAELLLDEGLAYRVESDVHVIPSFFVPEHWERFEAMDYGRNHPTAWPVFAVDNDGNVIVFDMYYSPGLVSEHVKAIQKCRKRWYPSGGMVVTYGPPDIKSKYGFIDPKGREISVETEFADRGIAFAPAQTDRRAGYLRIEEMLRRREDRRFPEWHPRTSELGAPHLYIFDIDALEPLISQLRDAPLEDPDSPLSRFPGEAVEQQWESDHGHAHAALRYGLMSRPGPSVPEVDPRLDDERAEALRQSFVRERAQEDESEEEYEFESWPVWSG